MRKLESRKVLSTGFLTTLAAIMAFTMAIPATASLDPTSYYGKVSPGDVITESKTVEVVKVAPKVDVVFAFDRTGSMSYTIAAAKLGAQSVMNALRTTTGSDFQFGVISYMDYPATYTSYGYAAEYGWPSDIPYVRNQVVTSNNAAVQTAINGLTLGNGMDRPECITRVLYETYADSGVGWRPGAKRVVINFSDSVPHDNNLLEGISAGTLSYGGDPGRDGVMFTEDDLDLQEVLGALADNNIQLIEALPVTSPDFFSKWTRWTGLTGGAAVYVNSASFQADVLAAVLNGVTEPTISGLTLSASAGYENWIESVTPASYSGPTGVDVAFELKIKVPATATGHHEFTVAAKDADGVVYGTQTVTLDVNGPPTVDADAASVSIAEGSEAEMTGTLSDPDDDALSISASIGTVVDNGDGTWTWKHASTDGPAQSGPVTISVDDGCGGTDATTFSLEVRNIVPEVGTLGVDVAVVPVGVTVKATATFTDPGTLDTHAVAMKWGDGTNSAGIVSESSGSGRATGSHVYTAAGVYALGTTTTDNDGGEGSAEFQYVVVYDPSAGFVTGGGTIASPAGAYVPDPTLAGKASFGFVSKYQKGANVPTGNTEFQFHAANMNFKSTSYDWLVIAGSKAQYKGTGTLNGAGVYTFMLTARDGGTGGDTLRVKIWNAGGVVYDNQMGAAQTDDPSTTLTGGSIVVHTSR